MHKVGSKVLITGLEAIHGSSGIIERYDPVIDCFAIRVGGNEPEGHYKWVKGRGHTGSEGTTVIVPGFIVSKAPLAKKESSPARFRALLTVSVLVSATPLLVFKSPIGELSACGLGLTAVALVFSGLARGLKMMILSFVWVVVLWLGFR